MDPRETLIPYLFSVHAQPHAEKIVEKPLAEAFEYIASVNMWGNDESVSGPGSSLSATETIRIEIPKLLRQLNARTFLDVPCGDFNWMQHVNLCGITYTGADIVPALIVKNVLAHHGTPFMVLDLTQGPIPKTDVVIVRDCLVHLSHENVWNVIRQLKKSKSKYLLTTNFPNTSSNRDIQNGDWRPINFQLEPFNFPEPLVGIVENCTEANSAFLDKSLGLWKISHLPKS